jgi:hypothetical protein
MMGGLMGAGQGGLAEAGMLATNQVGQIPTLAAGDTAAYAQQVDALRSAQLAKAAEVPFMEQAKAGFSKIGEAPGQFFKDNWKYAAAAAPSVLEAVSGSSSGAKPIPADKDMGQRYVYSPNKLQGPYTASPTGVEQQYFNPNYGKVSASEAKNIYGYADGGTVDEPVKYDYDPLTQIFKKIEAMPSDNQKVNEPSPVSGRGGINPQQGQINSYFDNLSPEGLAAHQQTQANVINALMPGSAVVKGLKALTEGEAGSNISPMAYPSLAMSKLGDAAQTGLGFVLNKFAKPNPNPDAVQVVDMSTRSPAAEAEGTVTVGDMSPADAASLAISQALAAQSSGGDAGGFIGGMGAGFGAPGATSGNAGAMGFGPSGMAGGYGGGSTGATSGATGGGGGGGGGGSPGAPALGASSGGGYATGPGGTAGVGGTAGGGAHGGLLPGFTHHMATGGLSDLGDYSDGGRLLKGPGDGVSDSIPAMIGKKQPARLADGEFVVPARIVSELGNGSTEAGARKLYAMMDRIQSARGKTVGKGKVAKNSRAERFLPA